VAGEWLFFFTELRDDILSLRWLVWWEIGPLWGSTGDLENNPFRKRVMLRKPHQFGKKPLTDCPAATDTSTP
jgi:hypothetical protein